MKLLKLGTMEDGVYLGPRRQLQPISNLTNSFRNLKGAIESLGQFAGNVRMVPDRDLTVRAKPEQNPLAW